MIEIVILGSGTAIPRPDRASPAVLVRSGETRLLVDCGPGTLRRAAAHGVHPGNLTGVLFTHYHHDHVLDLAALLFALRNPMYEGRAPLLVAGAPRLREILDHLLAGPTGGSLSPRGYDLDLREIEPGTHRLAGLEVDAVPVDHTPESLAYRIRDLPGGPVLAISGDTAAGAGVVDAGRDADLFLLECAVPDAAPFGRHLTPRSAADVAARAHPRRLVLTHFYPEVEAEPIEERIRERYAGELHLAVDDLAFFIGNPG